MFCSLSCSVLAWQQRGKVLIGTFNLWVKKINWQFHGNKTTRLKQKGKHNITWKQSNNLNKHPGDILRGITYPALVMCVTRLSEITVIIVNLVTLFEEKTTRSWFKQVKHIHRYWQNAFHHEQLTRDGFHKIFKDLFQTWPLGTLGFLV